MSTNNVWMIDLQSTYNEQECHNVFFYRGVALTSPTATEIAEQFLEQIFPDIDAITATDVFWVGVSVRDIMSAATPIFEPIGTNGGGGAGDTFPSHDAYGFTMGVGTNVTRPGSKRFVGVAEGNVQDGIVTGGGIIALLNDLAVTLALSLVDPLTGLVIQAVPVIVKRILDGDSYRLPETTGELVTNEVVDVSPNLIITTQNSRKQRAQ